MERAAALKKLTKLLGKSLAYRINERAPNPDEREAAREALPAAIAERERLKEAKDARYRTILAADAEYQELRAAHTAAKDHADRLSGTLRSYKITVGTTTSMFFVVKAEGDTWEEILVELVKKNAA